MGGQTSPSGAAGTGGSGFGSFRHLAARFFGALDPRRPTPGEEAWATGWLLPGEQELWRRMSGPDRRHAAGVARGTAQLLDRGAGGGPPPREVMASALLHDVGKVESGLGTFSRVAVTLAALAGGRERLTRPESGGRRAPALARGWPARQRARVRDYLTHDRIGAALLTAAGSHPTTVAWAAEHHMDPARWTLEPAVAAALKAADGD